MWNWLNLNLLEIFCIEDDLLSLLSPLTLCSTPRLPWTTRNSKAVLTRHANNNNKIFFWNFSKQIGPPLPSELYYDYSLRDRTTPLFLSHRDICLIKTSLNSELYLTEMSISKSKNNISNCPLRISFTLWGFKKKIKFNPFWVMFVRLWTPCTSQPVSPSFPLTPVSQPKILLTPWCSACPLP